MIGLDIGSVYIKAAEVTGARGRLTLNALGMVDTPRDTVANGVIVDPGAVAAAVRNLLTTNGFREKRAVISVGGQASLAVRVVDLPQMSDDELRRSMELDLDRHLPFPAEGTVYDYAKIQPSDAPADETTLEVLLAAAQEDLINGHIAVLDQVGLTPTAIDIEALAACRSLVNVAQNGDVPRTVAIVNMGALFTEITVVRDGIVRFVRAVPLGGEAFTTAIGQGFIVESARAEELKRQWATIFPGEGLEEREERRPPAAPPATHRTPLDLAPPEEEEVVVAPPEGEEPTRPAFDLAEEEEEAAPELEEISERMQEYLERGVTGPAPEEAAPPSEEQIGEDEEYTRRQMSRSLVGPLTDLAREIRSTIEYFATRKRMDVEQILLIGGSSKIQNIADFMAREIGAPVVLGNPFEYLTPTSEALQSDFLTSVAPLMAISTGLAIRDLI